ncbi:MAG: hypothetical protein IPK39_24140 [Sulfuritalea sp.]|nr:hypothetical protein [Sulfuritalea sp.]
MFGSQQNRILNADFLTLEIMVVLINACIGLLLLRNPPARKRQLPGGNRRQRVVLSLVALNLVLVLLFPRSSCSRRSPKPPCPRLKASISFCRQLPATTGGADPLH